MPENGEKSKIIWFLIALLQTIILGWSWRTEASMGQAKTDIATLQANYTNIMRELGDIKALLK